MDSERVAEVRRRLCWIAAARGVLCLFAAAIISLNIDLSSAKLSDLTPYTIVLAAFVLNTGYLVLAYTRMPWRVTAGAQTILDIALITGLVLVTGNISSDFRLLYFGPILAAAVLFSRSATLLVASLATIGIFSAAAFHMFAGPTVLAAIESAWPVPELVDNLAGALAIQAAAFHLVAYLAATLTVRLRSANIETEHILQNMSDGVITVARDGRVVFVNSQARRILALERPKPLIGASLASVAPAAACQAFAEVISFRQPASLEMDMGERHTPAQVTVLPLVDEAGRLRGANIVLHDLTERRRLTEALRRAERLEATAATVASIAHEIRNPLAAIRASAQELKKVLSVSGADARLLDLVVKESDRLNRVLTEFLNFSRMPKPQTNRFDLRELVDDVAEQLGISRGTAKPNIEVDGPPKMEIEGDSEQLRQVFINLGLNALDATGGEGPVRTSIEAAADGVTVRMRDRGTGLDESMKEKVFEPFFTTKTTGTGLGLPIARRIVEEHSGTLEFEKDGEGWTCVKVFLPQAERVVSL